MAAARESFTVEFCGSFPAVNLEAGANLSEHLHVQNSPILFGCRTGICGSCLIEIVEEKNGALLPPNEEEKEVLALINEDCPGARLACQIRLSADIALRPITGASSKP
jgi:ferredoxin